MLTPEFIFNIGNFAILIVWLLMLILPRWRATQWLTKTHIIVLFLAFCYTCIALSQLTTIAQADFTSLKGIKALFLSAGKEDYFVVAAWFHYLAFDLLAGSYIFHEAQKMKMSHFLLAPCLLLTFMLGPAGFLLFSILKISGKYNLPVGGEKYAQFL